MSVWNHLRKEAERQARQEEACQKVEEWCEEVREQARAIGEMHRKYKRPAKDGIDLNDSDTQWALSCEAVGDDSYWGD